MEANAQTESKSTTPRPRRLTRTRGVILLAGTVAAVAVCLVIRHWTGDPTADAQSRGFLGFGRSEPAEPAQPPAVIEQATATTARPERPQHDVMAVVNGRDINRAQLSHACVERFGEEVLESLVNKRLIAHHCRNRQIDVTQEEINTEIDRMAERFNMGRQQWLELLERERGINPEEYARDVLWPTLALRKLAADKLVVSEQELQEAHEMRYGPAIRARLLVVSSREKAEQLHRQLTDRPDEFARLAMDHSEDFNSASIGGLIQPIRRHMGDPQIEQVAFSLRPGDISPIIQVGEQLAILKCEEHLPRTNVPPEQVRAELSEQIKEGKLRQEAAVLFEELQASATVQNVWNDPQLSERLPGVVATVNGDQITMRQLGEECLLRYGDEVIEVEISHVLLQQALAKAGIKVTQEDINQEVAHAATLAGVVTEQGQPDFDAWFKLATEEQKVSKEMYLRDTVWPSAALKRLTGAGIEVTQDDLQKGFQANYGPRVRCRAIVLHNMRKAMDVWAKARQNPSMEYFGELAAEYSIEPTSRGLKGEVPPIRQHGGQPQLEDAAFKLAPGELSEVIQVGDRYIILKCEGRTDPIEVRPDEVDHVLRQDIYEKKLRIAMSKKYEDIRAGAEIDNYLAGTSQSPERPQQTPGGTAGTQHYDTAVEPTGATLNR
jgi:parvulin-like peptidyl-prolyl isomerase